MEIKKILIAGAGTMGYTISEIFAQKEFDVTIYDIEEKALSLARHAIINDYNEELAKKIKFTTDINSFKDTHLVIETIIENERIKKDFYHQISPIVTPTTILATNTSGISINSLAASVTLPERFIGMHWFNPSNLVPLIELIRGENTNEQTTNAINDLCLKIKKRPVVIRKDIPGFVANRIQFAILREVLDLIDKDVVDPDGVDDIMKYGLGFRYACVGPLETADFGGLDTFYHISEYLMKDLCVSPDIPKELKRHYDEGDLGVKTGKGFFDYPEDKAKIATQNRNRKLNQIYEALYSNEV